jgi:hypothetical protein
MLVVLVSFRAVSILVYILQEVQPRAVPMTAYTARLLATYVSEITLFIK